MEKRPPSKVQRYTQNRQRENTLALFVSVLAVDFWWTRQTSYETSWVLFYINSSPRFTKRKRRCMLERLDHKIETFLTSVGGTGKETMPRRTFARNNATGNGRRKLTFCSLYWKLWWRNFIVLAVWHPQLVIWGIRIVSRTKKGSTRSSHIRLTTTTPKDDGQSSLTAREYYPWSV